MEKIKSILLDSFTIDDIEDQVLLHKITGIEAMEIYADPKRRIGFKDGKERTAEEVYDHTLQGKVAEMRMHEKHSNLFLADRRFHDLKHNITGEYYEVKAYSVFRPDNSQVDKQVKRIKYGTNGKKWNFSSYLLLFDYDNGTYRFVEKINIYQK